MLVGPLTVNLAGHVNDVLYRRGVVDAPLVGDDEVVRHAVELAGAVDLDGGLRAVEDRAVSEDHGGQAVAVGLEVVHQQAEALLVGVVDVVGTPWAGSGQTNPASRPTRNRNINSVSTTVI